MTYITTEHLVDAATKAVTEELFREFDKALQSFCNEEQDRIVVFRTLRYTRIRLHVLQKYLPDDEAAARNTQSHFLDIALGYINTEGTARPVWRPSRITCYAHALDWHPCRISRVDLWVTGDALYR